MPKQARTKKAGPLRPFRDNHSATPAVSQAARAKRRLRVDGATRAKDADVRLALDKDMQAVYQVRNHRTAHDLIILIPSHSSASPASQ